MYSSTLLRSLEKYTHSPRWTPSSPDITPPPPPRFLSTLYERPAPPWRQPRSSCACFCYPFCACSCCFVYGLCPPAAYNAAAPQNPPPPPCKVSSLRNNTNVIWDTAAAVLFHSPSHSNSYEQSPTFHASIQHQHLFQSHNLALPHIHSLPPANLFLWSFRKNAKNAGYNLWNCSRNCIQVFSLRTACKYILYCVNVFAAALPCHL